MHHVIGNIVKTIKLWVTTDLGLDFLGYSLMNLWKIQECSQLIILPLTNTKCIHFILHWNKNWGDFQNLNCIALFSWQIKRLCPLFTIKKQTLSLTIHTHTHNEENIINIVYISKNLGQMMFGCYEKDAKILYSKTNLIFLMQKKGFTIIYIKVTFMTCMWEKGPHII